MPDISIGRLRGGFCVYWADEGKRRRFQLKARTRTEAEAEALDLYRRENFKSRPKDITIAEIWRDYMDDLGDRPTAKTMSYTGKAILPHFGPFTPEDITRDFCQEYHRTRKEAGKSQGTIWTELGHLQSALNFALQRKAPRVWRPIKPETDKRILTPNEIHSLIDAAHSPHIRLAIILLLGTAARVGALLDLTWDRVNFDRNAINLRMPGAYTRKGRAVVPMNSGVRAALSVAHGAALSDYVVEYAADRVGSIRKGFTSAVARAGIGHVRIHDLRHTAAVTMLQGGIPLEKVSQYLGHSNTAITFKTYARYLPDHMQDAADVLDFTGFRKAT